MSSQFRGMVFLFSRSITVRNRFRKRGAVRPLLAFEHRRRLDKGTCGECGASPLRTCKCPGAWS